jgi:hypothetical protein
MSKPISFSTSDLIAITIGTVGFFTAVVQIWLARRTSIRSGQLKQSHLLLRFGGISIANEALTIVYGTSWPPNERRAMTLRIILTNNGNRAAEHLKLSIVLPAAAGAPWGDKSFAPEVGISPGFESSSSRIGELVQTNLYIPILSPGETAFVDQPFALQASTAFDHRVHITTADKVDASLDVSIGYSLAFDIVLHSKEEPPISSRLYVR